MFLHTPNPDSEGNRPPIPLSNLSHYELLIEEPCILSASNSILSGSACIRFYYQQNCIGVWYSGPPSNSHKIKPVFDREKFEAALKDKVITGWATTYEGLGWRARRKFLSYASTLAMINQISIEDGIKVPDDIQRCCKVNHSDVRSLQRKHTQFPVDPEFFENLESEWIDACGRLRKLFKAIPEYLDVCTKAKVQTTVVTNNGYSELKSGYVLDWGDSIHHYVISNGIPTLFNKERTA